MRSTSTPSWTTVVFCLGMPSAMSRSSNGLANCDETGDASASISKTSCARSGTRCLDATSGGSGDGDAMDKAVAAIARHADRVRESHLASAAEHA